MLDEIKNPPIKNGVHINEHGTIFQFKNGLLHCSVGPAIEYTDGTKFYYTYGKLIAVKWYTGEVEYWINGEQWDYLPTEEEILTKEIIE